VENEIYELYPSARHAYIAIGLAVKTSRPQYVNERKGVSFFQKVGLSVVALLPYLNCLAA
jgi:hypothetical protein